LESYGYNVSVNYVKIAYLVTSDIIVPLDWRGHICTINIILEMEIEVKPTAIIDTMLCKVTWKSWIHLLAQKPRVLD